PRNSPPVRTRSCSSGISARQCLTSSPTMRRSSDQLSRLVSWRSTALRPRSNTMSGAATATATATEHVHALRALLGERGLIAGGFQMEAYETGARYDRGRAAFVARPASTQEVSALVSYCVRNGIHLIPQSGNTGLVSGSTPNGSGTQGVLSLERVFTPLAVDRVNRSVHVGAGMRLSELNAR